MKKPKLDSTRHAIREVTTEQLAQATGGLGRNLSRVTQLTAEQLAQATGGVNRNLKRVATIFAFPDQF